jgi:S-adenosylmethionine synthetase
MAVAIIDGKESAIPANYDLTPTGIRQFLKLEQQQYTETAIWGHFGRGFEWDK